MFSPPKIAYTSVLLFIYSKPLISCCLFLHCSPQVENDFILLLEKEVFIEQLKDIVDKAEDMLSEDTEGERNSDQGGSPKQSEGAGALGTEVRKELLTVNSYNGKICLRVPLLLIHHPDSTLKMALHATLQTRAAKNTILADVTF